VSQIEEFVSRARTLPLNRAKTEERANRIRAAVIEECVEKSFRHASMADIAKRAHVSTASLYREYSNRETLLGEVANFVAPMIAAEFTKDLGAQDPQERLRTLLIRHGQVFQDPYVTWLYRAHVSGEVFEGRGLIPLGRSTREAIEAFWAQEVSFLEAIDQAGPAQVRQIVNFVLGGVQRRTLVATLLFGPEDESAPDLETAAQSALDWIIALHATSSTKSQNGRDTLAPLRLETVGESLVQRHVQANLSRPHDRSDIAARHQKILAAAVQECSEVGFDAASMASVAHRANVSTATLYDHFEDKDDMFIKCVDYIVPFLTEAVTRIPETNDPRERVAQMLVYHGEAYIDPFMGWLYRLYVSFDDKGGMGARRLGQASRTMVEQFWTKQLKSLEADGYLLPSDPVITLNVLLGCVERRTLISYLLFGSDRANRDELLASAEYAANVLFQRYGTDKFRNEFCQPQRFLESA
jgi:AcrR family transcriptional regulator